MLSHHERHDNTTAILGQKILCYTKPSMAAQVQKVCYIDRDAQGCQGMHRQKLWRLAAQVQKVRPRPETNTSPAEISGTQSEVNNQLEHPPNISLNAYPVKPNSQTLSEGTATALPHAFANPAANSVKRS